jgi:hypothetical protein
MTSKQLCTICDKPVYEKQKSIRCAVCDQRFHHSCLKVNDSDLMFCTSSGQFSVKCETCSRLQRATRNDDTLVRPQGSVPASEASKSVISPEHELLLPELASTESLSVQIETVRFNGQTTITLVEKLVSMVSDLTSEVVHLKSGNASLKSQISDLRDLFSSRSSHLEYFL